MRIARIRNCRRIMAAPGILLALCVLLSSGCGTLSSQSRMLPPILQLDQLQQSYVRIGTVQVSRDRYGSSVDLTANDFDWAHNALREEANKLGADAIIAPEVRVETISVLLFPAAEIIARATAIKFR